MTPDMLEQLVRAETLAWIALVVAVVALYRTDKK